MTYYHEKAVEAILKTADRMANYAEQLRQYAKDMEDDRKVLPSERMVWAINDIENLMRNFDFNQLARICGDLRVEEAEARTEKRKAMLKEVARVDAKLKKVLGT